MRAKKPRGFWAQRLPFSRWWRRHFLDYRVPANLNLSYVLGSIALVLLGVQVISGFALALNYVAVDQEAFASVERIMRDIRWGWLWRYAHAAGASLLILSVYLHMAKALVYGSYRQPREVLWLLGMLLWMLLLAEAFLGYLLPWGQMSFWAARVISSVLAAVPGIGDTLADIFHSGALSGHALSRFFVFHVIALPALLALMVMLHIIALREVGANNPEGGRVWRSSPKRERWMSKMPKVEGWQLRTLPFHPYFTSKDMVAVLASILVLAGVVFYWPAGGGLILEPLNTVPANPLHTPDDIVPAWYLAPFYAILRAVTFTGFGVSAKTWGVLVVMVSVALLMLLPWLDRAPVRSMRYRAWPARGCLALMLLSFLGLGWCGMHKASDLMLLLSQGLVCGYFLSIAGLAVISRFEVAPEGAPDFDEHADGVCLDEQK